MPIDDDGLDSALEPDVGDGRADAAFVAAGAGARDGCRNCGAVVEGRFCGQCGQRRDLRPLSLLSLVWELLIEILDSDARVWRTLRALVLRPGALTLAWAEGRRATYMPPLRLYIVLNLLAFLVLSLQSEPIVIGDDAEAGRSEAEAELVARLDDLEDEAGPGVSGERAGLRAALAQLRERRMDGVDRDLTRAGALLEEALARARRDGRPGDVEHIESALGALDPLLAPRAPAAAGEAPSGEATVPDGATTPATTDEGYVVFDGSRISVATEDDLLVRLGYPRERVQAAFDRLTADPGRALDLLYERLPVVAALLLPLLATVLRGLYLFGDRPWVVHLVGLAHLHAFGFLLLLLVDGFAGFGLLLSELGVPIAADALGRTAGLLALLVLPVYVALWARALYGHGWPGAIALTFTLSVLELIGAALGVALLVVVTLIAEVVFGG